MAFESFYIKKESRDTLFADIPYTHFEVINIFEKHLNNLENIKSKEPL